ncbi:MAG: alanine--glyoxylate aminotransferase family protein [Turicibacter sp.]|nr:alanine--glyoxylate aminotransferase family protein [Turicibacter sp.]
MSKVLFTPGPTNIPEEIRQVLSQDLIHHRMAEYHQLLKEINEDLKTVFDTKNDVLILTASGTGSMESSVVNLFSKNDSVLVINTGWFGQRFIEICQVYGLHVHELRYEWGETYNIAEVKAMLEKHPDIKGIFVTYHETSTGVANNLKLLGDLTKNTERLLIADCISGMIVQEFHLDQWGVDCAVASSQKGFLLPPGLSFVALSDKAKTALEHSNLPKYYWDYRKYLNSLHNKLEQPFTPSISIVVALQIALRQLLTKGLTQIIQEKMCLRTYAEEQFEKLGFILFIEDESIRGNVLVPVIVPKGVDGGKLTTLLDKQYDFTVAGGMGAYAKQMLRVGIIGEITKKEVDLLIEYIQNILPECKE